MRTAARHQGSVHDPIVVQAQGPCLPASFASPRLPLPNAGPRAYPVQCLSGAALGLGEVDSWAWGEGGGVFDTGRVDEDLVDQEYDFGRAVLVVRMCQDHLVVQQA